jgi:hypothetical protein
VENFARGTVVDGKYEILSSIGSGGFGTVYQAQQLQLDRLVALKALNGYFAESDMMVRFEREALAISSMQHKNLVTFYGYGIWQHTAYIIMEYLEGQSLERILKAKQRFAVPEALSIVRQVCEALKCAHAHGIVHRDLKPTNVMMLDRDFGDNVKVIDFGLAKLTANFGMDLQKLTAEGFAVGSVSYMSPEQCVTGQVDQRSDLYSAGCILHACLTGLPPFSEGDSLVIMRSHVHSAPDSLAKSCPDATFPDGLQDIVYKALAKEPDDRYQSADEMLHDLAILSSSKRMKLLGTGAKPAAKKWAAPNAVIINRMVLAAVAVVVVAGCVLGLSKFFYAENSDEHISTSSIAYKNALMLDTPTFDNGDASRPIAAAYEQAVRLARADHLLNNNVLLKINVRLARLAKMRGAPTDEELFAREACDIAGRAGGGGTDRMDATSLLIDSYCRRNNFTEAIRMPEQYFRRMEIGARPDPDSPSVMGLFCSSGDAYFGAGLFDKYDTCMGLLDPGKSPNDPPELLKQRILVMKAEQEILHKKYAQANKLLIEALYMKDSLGRVIYDNPGSERGLLAARIVADLWRSAILQRNWNKANEYKNLSGKTFDIAHRSKQSLYALMLAHDGRWDDAVQELDVRLEYLKISPAAIYVTWAFLDVPEFIRLAKEAKKDDIVVALQDRLDKLMHTR